jgi:hypothetical protein
MRHRYCKKVSNLLQILSEFVSGMRKFGGCRRVFTVELTSKYPPKWRFRRALFLEFVDPVTRMLKSGYKLSY